MPRGGPLRAEVAGDPRQRGPVRRAVQGLGLQTRRGCAGRAGPSQQQKKEPLPSATPLGSWKVTDGGWKVTDGGWKVTDGGWKVTDGGWKVTDGGWKVTDGGWKVTDGGWRGTDGSP